MKINKDICHYVIMKYFNLYIIKNQCQILKNPNKYLIQFKI